MQYFIYISTYILTMIFNVYYNGRNTSIRKKVGHRYTKRDSRGTDACALR